MSDRSYRRPAILDRIALDRHCVIEASAGTGKTFTIEHLVVEILFNTDLRLEQILAVTFTEKAAAELRTRIRRTLEKTLIGDSGTKESAGTVITLDEAMIRRLENALFSFERAPIHTIHSFCHRMLTDLAFESGARMQLEVADARTMFHEAFRAELRERFASDEWMSRVLAEWLDDDRDTDRLEALLFDAHRRRYHESGAVERNSRAVAALLEGFDANQLESALRSARAKKGVFTAFEDLREAVKKSNRDPSLLRRELGSTDLTKLADLEKLSGLPEEVRRVFATLRSVQFASNLDARAIDTFLGPVAARLALLKRERGFIDYDDMPGWLWSALSGPQGDRLAAALRERFRVGIVDEFQDTDDLQWRIFRKLFVESETHRLIVIGDPKQAIYAFRDADVFAYLKAKTELHALGAKIVPLTENFRSTAEMIDAINLIFAPAPGQTFFVDGDIAYDHPVKCARPDVSFLQGGKPAKPITLFSFPADAGLSARRYRMMLGRKIAATLKSLIDGSESLEIAGPSSRIVPAREVFVLTRTLMESREMAGYLREAGVPYAFYKQDGLFKTREAGHVLDVLRAVADPQRRSNRLKAWSTPFFGVALRDLPGLDDVAPSHPLMARLLEWKALAEAESFADLFSAMLHQSGLAARELLLADSQRELTNYEHIFEVLLENSTSDARDLTDLVQMLASWVDGDDLPPGENPGVQRLESERDAVQIMTVHKAKGLEADVVVLFGGYGQAPPQRDKVSVFHADGARQVIAGTSARAAAKPELDRESNAEDERLLYVALTRARAKLYLAMFAEKATLRAINGYYRKLNDRLLALEADKGDAHKVFEKVTETIRLRKSGSTSPSEEPAEIGSWTPPEELLRDDGDRKLARSLREIVTHHSALAINSYTSLQRRASMNARADDDAALKYDLDSDGADADAPGDLAGGRAVGIFLHEVIERLDLDDLRTAPDLASWKASPGVQELIAATARRHRVRDSDRWHQRAAEIVFNALRSPIALGGEDAPTLASCEPVREMAFTFPIPAADHPLLGANRDSKWKIERGLLIGFVDLVFRHKGRTYFADWKSDLLSSYDEAAVAAHVADRYLIQARIYTIGILRLLRIRDRREYEERFGGLVYVFLRGVEPRGDGRSGVYFHRPSWEEIVAYEQTLMSPA
ncbi:MAG TPA: UvrD-helicase domain-containing protein [Candidatus Binataceae bacterium]|nr:UvrD-helicase domain-containing protein [Candidatus Binataceae bacterium]